MNIPLVNAISLNLISIIVRVENACETEPVIETRKITQGSLKRGVLAHTLTRRSLCRRIFMLLPTHSILVVIRSHDPTATIKALIFISMVRDHTFA
jgi:hypothetical protein